MNSPMLIKNVENAKRIYNITNLLKHVLQYYYVILIFVENLYYVRAKGCITINGGDLSLKALNQLLI